MTRLSIIPLTALTLSGILSSGLNWLEPAVMNQKTLNSHVGVVVGKCCQMGRRWGCDPTNFGQSGCTKIGNPVNCERRRWATMKCTSAECHRSNTEHRCEVDIKTVRHNRCRTTGLTSTVGCPEEHWQCQVEMRPHTIPTNPKSDVIVCDEKVSTLCGTDFAPCD
jgi:hypothetical protein